MKCYQQLLLGTKNKIEMFDKLLNKIFSLQRRTKRIFQLIVDSTIIVFSYIAALYIKLGSVTELSKSHDIYIPLLITLIATLLVFIRLGFYKAIIRYISNKAAITIILGSLTSTAVMWFALSYYSYPPTIAIIYGSFIFIFIGGIRIILREYYLRRGNKFLTKALIYGAGSAGRQLAEFMLNHRQSYMPVGFIDDNDDLIGSELMGLNIYSPKSLSNIIPSFNISVIFLAVPSTSSLVRNRIITELEDYKVEVRTVPKLDDIVSGKSNINETKIIDVDELLERKSIEPIHEILNRDILGKVILVTGAGGSIGSELTRQIIKLSPEKIILLDISEYALYKIDQEINKVITKDRIKIQTVLGSVADDELLDNIFKSNTIDTVYHAAAYKHVPLVEVNIIPGLMNNTFGTMKLYEKSIKYSVSSFVLISTDKAVRPKSIMGASKRLAELACLSLHRESSTNSKLSIVRFGNVLGSSGSVIPKFQSQIQNGGPVTVTDPNVDRYFMTINEAVELVIQAGSLNKNSNIFVLDMGESINILNLAKRLVRLSGYIPYTSEDSDKNGDMEIIFTGLRSGEKMSEELYLDDKLHSTEHEKINLSIEPEINSSVVIHLLNNIKKSCDDNDHERIKKLLSSDIIKYH